MSIIFGILAGIGVPIQTSINARLRKKVGSPYRGIACIFCSFIDIFSIVIIDFRTGCTYSI